VEHPFVTIKRSRLIREGFEHILTKKGIKAASADFGLMAIAYPSAKYSGQVIKKITEYKRAI
jgi:hypothetical protein